MQAASPEVARAGASQQPSPVLVSSGGANNSVCSLRVHSSSWPCPRYSEQLAARSHRLCVRPAPQIFKGKPRASCGRAESLQSVRTARGGANPRWWCVSHVGMMVIGPECGGCVCGRCVCDVHAWMRRAVWAMGLWLSVWGYAKTKVSWGSCGCNRSTSKYFFYFVDSLFRDSMKFHFYLSLSSIA